MERVGHLRWAFTAEEGSVVLSSGVKAQVLKQFTGDLKESKQSAD